MQAATVALVHHPDDLRKQRQAELFASRDVAAIGCMLANVERQRLKLSPILSLAELDTDEADHFKHHAVRAINMLNQDAIDEAVYIGASVYAGKAWDAGFEGLSLHRKGHCVWAVRSIINAVNHALSGYLPVSGAEARAWQALAKKMDGRLRDMDAIDA